MIPYGDITEMADRRWTARLLDRLGEADLGDEELHDLVGALQKLSDPRSVGPLEAILVDPAGPELVREAARCVLGGMEYTAADPAGSLLRDWWRHGDATLRKYALSCMCAVDCPDIVLQVAADPSHELNGDAVGRMTFCFDRPEYERLKIDALAHPDPQVREAAASCLLWDEPIAAELPLIEATRDAVPRVAAEACGTLQYYPSLRTASCLYGLFDHPADEVRGEAKESFREVRAEFLLGLSSRDPRVARHLRRWLEPVWNLLAFTAEELHPVERHPNKAPSTPDPPILLDSLLGMLGDPDASPKTIQRALWRCDWSSLAATERGRLRRVLVGHPEGYVRKEAAAACEAWGDTDGLLSLFKDCELGVRKAAMYRLSLLPPTPDIADLAWGYLNRPDVVGVHATETLGTFVRHADPAVAMRRLGWIAGDHGWREGLRTSSVYHLLELGAAETLSQLAGLLLEPPAVTWSLHIALIDATAKLGLPRPDVGHLLDVDNLHVQEAVAQVI